MYDIVPMPSSGPRLIEFSDLVSPLLKYEDVHPHIPVIATETLIKGEPVKKMKADMGIWQ